MSIIQAIHLKKYYHTGNMITKAVDGVSFTIEPGEFVSIVGKSGSGKSTLLHLLGGLDTPTSGKIKIQNQDITTLTDDEKTIFRRRNIGFIFQNYNLIPSLNIYDNIVLPLELDGEHIDKNFFNALIDTLFLKEKLNSMPYELSGGQQQRVAIARALITKPAIVLADEPTGNLDSAMGNEVASLLKITNYRFHQTLLMITHNNEIAQLADRIFKIEDGKLLC